jgi:hypothetical protein
MRDDGNTEALAAHRHALGDTTLDRAGGTREAVEAGSDRNHVLSRRIVDAYPHALLGWEDLTYMRERTRRRHGKKVSQKQRRANRHSSQWAFAQLHCFLA